MLKVWNLQYAATTQKKKTTKSFKHELNNNIIKIGNLKQILNPN